MTLECQLLDSLVSVNMLQVQTRLNPCSGKQLALACQKKFYYTETFAALNYEIHKCLSSPSISRNSNNESFS